jgi:hypothetical protein
MLGALSSRSVLSVLVGALFKMVGLFLIRGVYVYSVGNWFQLVTGYRFNRTGDFWHKTTKGRRCGKSNLVTSRDNCSVSSVHPVSRKAANECVSKNVSAMGRYCSLLKMFKFLFFLLLKFQKKKLR